MFRTVSLTVNGREFTLRYSSCSLMEQSIRGALGGEYPSLQEEPGVILNVGPTSAAPRFSSMLSTPVSLQKKTPS
jgi:hypothetical protein